METRFFLTTVRLSEEELSDGPPTGRSQRCVAFSPSLDDLKNIIEENVGDIWEYTFNFAVIEEIEEGLYGHVHNEYWYSWDNEKKRYMPTNKPECVQYCVNFSIG